MSFSTFDLSTWLGRPISLYKFTCGNKTWLYTSTSNDYTYNNSIYSAIPIKHGGYEIGQDELKSDLEIVAARTIDISALFIGQPPEHIMYVTIYKIHKNDDDPIIEWQGYVATSEPSGDEVIFKCQSDEANMSQSGLVMFSRQCRYALYSTGCGLIASDFAIRLHDVSISNRTLTHEYLANQIDGWWVGGFAELDNGAKRMVIAHTTSTVTINYPFSDNVGNSTTITFYAGCDLSIGTCHSKFNNRDNFGGQPSIPLNNPFTGDRVS